MVVMRTPALDDLACIIEAGEPVQIKAVLAELAMEAFDERILSWFARLNEVQLHFGAPRPTEHRFARELWSIVAHQCLWKCPTLRKPIEFIG